MDYLDGLAYDDDLIDSITKVNEFLNGIIHDESIIDKESEVVTFIDSLVKEDGYNEKLAIARDDIIAMLQNFTDV